MNRGWKIIAVSVSVILLAAALAVYMKSATAVAEGQVVGFVDSEAILAAYGPAKDVNAELANLRKLSEEALKKQVQDKYGTGDMSSLPEESQLTIQKMVEDADRKYQSDMEKLRDEKWNPIVKTVNDVIKQVGDEQKVQVVLEKAAVVYGGLDLTEEVIKKLPAKK